MDRLNEIRAVGKLDYADYSYLHDELSELAAYKDIFDNPAQAHYILSNYQKLLKETAELVKAEADGRLVMLDEKMLPMRWGDEDRETLLCPNCERDLMGGYPDDSLGSIVMWQCRYCGQPINPYEATHEAEAG